MSAETGASVRDRATALGLVLGAPSLMKGAAVTNAYSGPALIPGAGRGPLRSPAANRRSRAGGPAVPRDTRDRKSTRLNSSHLVISYAVFCLKKKKDDENT